MTPGKSFAVDALLTLGTLLGFGGAILAWTIDPPVIGLAITITGFLIVMATGRYIRRIARTQIARLNREQRRTI